MVAMQDDQSAAHRSVQSDGNQHARTGDTGQTGDPPGGQWPELTVRAILLGAVLSMILGAANMYLGLKAGMTVAASIPAAVISMGILRLLGRGNVLENNIVQTGASAGESLAAGVIFTMPALLILGAWREFDYWQTTAIAGLGGVIGVLFTIPLRRALVVGSQLKYPEGVATAEVLRAGQAGGGLKMLAAGGAVGALFKLGESGLRLWVAVAEGAVRLGGTVGYLGLNLAPALLAVGYIVRLNIALLVFVGGALNWFVAIPIMAARRGVPADAAPAEFAWELWSEETRYIGVGAMVVGGLWALFRLIGPLTRGIAASMAAYHQVRREGGDSIERAERDTPIHFVAVALLACTLPVLLLYAHVTQNWPIAGVMTVAMLVAGFLFSAVAAYMAGLVGSSNNPVSGVTIATLLFASLLLLLLGMDTTAGPTAAILIGAVVCCAAAIGGDNMQDLKAGQLVGATPWKQQVMQMVGVVSGAFVMAPVASRLHEAYTIGSKQLAAPQATLMASVARGVFEQNLPWAMLAVGMALAVAVIVLDLVLAARGSEFRTPVLAVAVGLYLPLELGTTIFLGGLVAAVAHGRFLRLFSRGRQAPQESGGAEEAEGKLQASLREAEAAGERRGLLMAAGLITGEALAGIGLAFVIVGAGGENPLEVALPSVPAWPGLILLAGVAGLLLWTAAGRQESGSR